MTGNSSAPRQLAEPASRAPRPGQQPPVFTRASAKRPADDDSDSASSPSRPRPSSAPNSHKLRKEKEARNWKEQRASNVVAYTSCFPRLQQFWADAEQNASHCVMQRLQAALERHRCCLADHGMDCLQLEKSRPVTCWSLGISFDINLAYYR